MAGLVSAAWLAGCVPDDAAVRPAIEVIDDEGVAVSLTAPARRIVSLIPARTDLILALNAGDRLIARTQYDEDPRIAHVPSVGNALMPSVEWLTERRPDLVVAWPDQQSRSVVTRLRGLGIPVYASRVQSLEDVDRSLEHLGTLLGVERTADSLRAAIQGQFQEARRTAAEGPDPLVAYIIGLDPAMVAGPGTYIDQLLNIAGARNAFSNASGLWPTIALEELLRRQPDHLLLALGAGTADDVLEELRSRAGWRELRAVRDGRVHALDAALFNRPGARVGEAAIRLAELLHPSGRRTGPP